MLIAKNFLFCSMLLAGTSIHANQPDKPNIIIFLIDDMGVMDTSVPFLTDGNGNIESHPLNEWYHTPNMETLAKKGIRFSKFYAQSVSSPSRASLMTGRNSARHRTTTWINAYNNNRSKYGPSDWNWNGLDPNEPLLPILLKQNGYKTIHIGKAHFGPKGSIAEDPLNLGFDINIGGSGIGHPGSYYGEDGYGHIKGSASNAVPHLDKYHGTDTFLTDALTIEANNEISNAVQEKSPFFLYLSHYAIHAPFQPDKRYIERYNQNTKGSYADAYASLVEGMDKSLGDLMRHLEKEGIADNTLIIFLGDNGGDAPLGNEKGHFSSAPLKGKKGSVYEGGTRVPFIMSWGKPATNNIQKKFPIQQNAVQLQYGTIMDIYPTILNITGIKPVKEYYSDGISLIKQMNNKHNNRRSGNILMHFPHGDHRGVYFTTLIKNDWKIIYHYNPEDPVNPYYELYNLKNDPYENNNLSLSERQQTRNMIITMIKELGEQNALYPIDKNGVELRPVIPEA